ncbi:efflux RND transporter periplasmic adaptor subunit [Oricola thermophila]|uniref:HlyD family efflux transporter periplasmic adaptor subunit n=1 Tax=Oricola thermophila TaxID=2742145 RepID=A0A6N1VD64_9HYPH|nr:HlyD family efflux transporter periplasmic adaptor subunit [Oricola thermophila]QKV18840.1 HlyD family efflux transporter periplasmic adaptor subunit [Oricola thermophila]
MPFNLRTNVGILAGLAALTGLLYVTFRDDPVPVDIVSAKRDVMRVTVDADGKTRIKDIYEVSAPIAGTAQRSPVAVGERVVGGETVVAVVRPAEIGFLDARTRVQAEAAVREAEAALQAADTSVRQAEEELNYAITQYSRIQTLVDRGVASLTQLEDAAQIKALREAALDAARANRAASESALERARAALIEPGLMQDGEVDENCCVPILAPADGVVLDIVNVSERPVQAGTPLLSIGQPDNLEIVADILSSEAVRIEEGAPALVERWGGEETLHARVREIEPAARTKVSALGIEEQRVDVTLDFENGEIAGKGLGNGYAVFVRIIVWEGSDVLQVPVSALFRADGEWALFIYDEGVARQVPVEIGRRSGLMAEIVSGVEEGTMVITHPSDRVADGVDVVDRSTL